MDPNAELLAQLNDIVVPQAGFPVAPGWIVLAILLLLGAVALYRIWRKRQKFHASDWRPAARQELSDIRNRFESGESDLLSDCSRLARRTALAIAPRGEVAALSGQAWLQKLDEIVDDKSFTEGNGRLLATGPYQQDSPTDREQLQGLITVLEQLVSKAATK